jgi:putative ATPase
MSKQAQKVKDNQSNKPLADILRPQDFNNIIGQKHLFGKDGIMTRIINSKKIPSTIFYGPAGCGKTTIAKNLAKINEDCHEEILLATNSNTAELRKIFEASKNRKQDGIDTILIVDEIHHFNRTQQDLFLPFIEDGTITLIGATTENPSFELNSALLSRCRIIFLKSLDSEDLDQIISKCEDYFDKEFALNKEARKELVELCCGDARYLINLCEELSNYSGKEEIDAIKLLELVQKKSANYDKDRDGHYGLISAFHKALRGSDVDAALYYQARMMLAGENPHYILRRLTRFASEDVGIADPEALKQCLAAKESYDFLGSPEGDYAISNAVIYCATAPKSNASYVAHKKAFEMARQYNNYSPPKHILNAPTKFMKDQGLKEGYIYDHDTPNCFSGQEYFPEELLKKNNGRPRFYEPNQRGFERDVVKRLDYWRKLKGCK